MSEPGPATKQALSFYDPCGLEWRWSIIPFALLSLAIWNWFQGYGLSGQDWFFGFSFSVFTLGTLVNFGLARRVVIDRRLATVLVKRGFVLPLWGTAQPLDEFSSVRLSKGRKRLLGKAYRVDLLGYGGRPVCIGNCPTYHLAQARAQVVAQFLAVELSDTTPQGTTG